MYGVSYDSVTWHLENHMTEKMTLAMEKEKTREGADLLKRINKMMAKLEKIIERNEYKEDGLSIRGISVWTKMLEVLAGLEIHLQTMIDANEHNKPLGVEELPIEELSPEAQELLFEITAMQLGTPIKRSNNNRYQEITNDENDNKRVIGLETTSLEPQNRKKLKRRHRKDPIPKD
jgi:hypothetical protein